jgi:hypothetical protein
MANQREIAEKLGRFGFIGKGIFYVLIGVLAAMFAFGSGGAKKGKRGILQFIENQPGGDIMLYAMAFLIFGYVIYKFYKAFVRKSFRDSEKKAKVKQVANFLAGVFYSILIYATISIAMSSGGSGGSGNKRQTLVHDVLGMSGGQIIIGIVAVGFFIKA